jgi:hypothetical protein
MRKKTLTAFPFAAAFDHAHSPALAHLHGGALCFPARTRNTKKKMKKRLSQNTQTNKPQHHRVVGDRLAARLAAAGVTEVAWVRRAGQRYHGRARALMEGLAAGGVRLG